MSRNALSWNFPYITGILLKYYNCQICFYGFSVYANVHVSASIYFLVFFLWLFLYLFCFVSTLACLYFIFFKDVCLFFNEQERERERNGIDVGVRGAGGGEIVSRL